MKRDTTRFPRAIGPRGEVTNIVSPLSEAARDADARAFKAVMEFLREHDTERRVIMMQVENEVGFLGNTAIIRMRETANSIRPCRRN